MRSRTISTSRTSAIPRGVRTAILYLAAFALVLFAIAPVYWVFASSLSTRAELYSAPYKHWIPSQPTLDNYGALFGGTGIRGSSSIPSGEILLAALRNSTVTSVVTACLVTILSIAAGFAFARLRFPGKRPIFIALLAMLPVPPWAAFVSLYFIFARLNLIDSLLGMILVFVIYKIPMYVWLMRTFIDGTSREVEEAALVDGCSRLGALVRVVVPMARSGIVSVFLVSFLLTWNAFLVPLIFSESTASQTLTIALSLFVGQYEVQWETMSAMAVLVILPPLLLALFFQRYLVRGLSMGAVK